MCRFRKSAACAIGVRKASALVAPCNLRRIHCHKLRSRSRRRCWQSCHRGQTTTTLNQCEEMRQGPRRKCSVQSRAALSAQFSTPALNLFSSSKIRIWRGCDASWWMHRQIQPEKLRKRAVWRGSWKRRARMCLKGTWNVKRSFERKTRPR